MSRIDRRQRDFERREQEIFDAALDLCSGPGIESVTMEQIAERAEVGKGTVYKHVASKDELLFRLMMRFYGGLLEDLREHTEGPSPLERFRVAVERALRYHLTHREYRFIVEYCERIDFKERARPEWRAAFHELDRAFDAWSSPLVEAGMANGAFERRPIPGVMIGMHACVLGAVKMLWAGANWCVHGDEHSIVPAVTDFVLSGLIGRPATLGHPFAKSAPPVDALALEP